jgi:tRNA (cytidine/uridine-2'-O-)-methyltransferase
MINIVLYEPEIAPNTGNIIRLCANSGAQLHLIEPLGFRVDDTKLKRAGLDYHDWSKVMIHPDYFAFIQTCSPKKLYACSTKGKTQYTQIDATNTQESIFLLFGPETRGLPQAILDTFENNFIIRIPMVPNNRSLNLSNAVAVILYDVWRQQNFLGSRE